MQLNSSDAISVLSPLENPVKQFKKKRLFLGDVISIFSRLSYTDNTTKSLNVTQGVQIVLGEDVSSSDGKCAAPRKCPLKCFLFV